MLNNDSSCMHKPFSLKKNRKISGENSKMFLFFVGKKENQLRFSFHFYLFFAGSFRENSDRAREGDGSILSGQNEDVFSFPRNFAPQTSASPNFDANRFFSNLGGQNSSFFVHLFQSSLP